VPIGIPFFIIYYKVVANYIEYIILTTHMSLKGTDDPKKGKKEVKRANFKNAPGNGIFLHNISYHTHKIYRLQFINMECN